MRANLGYILQALLAALFFGASAPLSKLFLIDVPPVLMASFLYLGSGTGISLVKLSQQLTSTHREAGIKGPDVKWLAGAIISGGKGTADEKFAALEDAGVKTVRSLAEIGSALAEVTGW